jgi:hypothetical protein
VHTASAPYSPSHALFYRYQLPRQDLLCLLFSSWLCWWYKNCTPKWWILGMKLMYKKPLKHILLYLLCSLICVSLSCLVSTTACGWLFYHQTYISLDFYNSTVHPCWLFLFSNTEGLCLWIPLVLTLFQDKSMCWITLIYHLLELIKYNIIL